MNIDVPIIHIFENYMIFSKECPVMSLSMHEDGNVTLLDYSEILNQNGELKKVIDG